MLVVFNLDQLSAIFMSFIDFGFRFAFFLNSLCFIILFIFFTISRNLISPFKNKSTRTSLAAFMIMGVDKPDDHDNKSYCEDLTEGKFFELTF